MNLENIATSSLKQDGYYLGADPGIKNFGYGVVRIDRGQISFVNCGCMPNLAKNNAQMLNDIRTGMLITLEQYNIVEAAFEEVFFMGNKTSALSTAKCIGAFEMACAELDIPCSGVVPSSLKKKIAGNGRASKDDMKTAVISYLEEDLNYQIENYGEVVPENDSAHPYWKKQQIENTNNHALDAVAVALWLARGE